MIRPARHDDIAGSMIKQKQTLDDEEKLVDQIQGTVKNDQGTVEYDQIQVDFCHIVSPITGRVGLRLVDPGNVVQANGSTVLTSHSFPSRGEALTRTSSSPSNRSSRSVRLSRWMMSSSRTPIVL